MIVLIAGVAAGSDPEVPRPGAVREKATLFAAAAAFCVAWLAAFRLEISEDHVRYRSLLRGSRTVRKADIVAAHFADPPRATESPATFVIRTSSGDELRINAKPFPIEATQSLLDLAAA
jgi:hypothetical protein